MIAEDDGISFTTRTTTTTTRKTAMNDPFSSLSLSLPFSLLIIVHRRKAQLALS
jgi:hypothetical protein